MRFKFVTHHHNPSKFQSPAVHKYLDTSGTIQNSCYCTFCFGYQPDYAVERTKYQDLFPYGQDTTEETNEDTIEDTTKAISQMAPATNEEQFKFLISCIRHSNNGKVDFTEVANECNIVSKGAAAKRYERMMKANGIHQSQSGPTTVSSIRDTPVPSPRRKTSPSAGPSNKKRKLDSYAETTSNVNTDDDEGLCNVKTESSIKAEVKAEPIKEDPTMEEVTADSTASIGTFQPAFRDTMGFDGANDGSLFDDFLAFGGSLPTMGNGDEHGNKETILIAD